MKPEILFFCLFSLCYLIGDSNGFIPATLLDSKIMKLNKFLGGTFGKVMDSHTHEEITRKGIIRSVVRFFRDHQNGSSNVNLTKTDSDYQTLSRLYYDVYGRSVCLPGLEILLKFVFQPNVVKVDLASSTKRLVSAHFDAEKLVESNNRIIDMTADIDAKIISGEFLNARRLAGQVLHTIQDFYSHSNWVEMKNTKINKLMGTKEFSSQDLIDVNVQACYDNCDLISEKCTKLQYIFSWILEILGQESEWSACPLEYWKCDDNIKVLDKLLTGYVSDQILDDGTLSNKPTDVLKCSHGGVLDGGSTVQARGGINKDSGYLLFSPGAKLHEKAAKLAMDHTEFYFNGIRTRVGDHRFNKFLDLTVNDIVLSSLPSEYTCKSSRFTINSGLLLLGLLFSFIFDRMTIF